MFLHCIEIDERSRTADYFVLRSGWRVSTEYWWKVGRWREDDGHNF